MPGKRRCAVCAERHRLREKERADKRRAANLCVTCGADVVPGRSYCADHLWYFATSNAVYKSAKRKLRVMMSSKDIARDTAGGEDQDQKPAF